MDPRLEEGGREIVSLGLDVLRKGQGYRPGVRRGEEHPHRLGESGDELLQPVDPVPVAGHRFEAVVDRDVL